MKRRLWPAGLGVGAATLLALTVASGAAGGPSDAEQTHLTAPDAAAGDQFGWDVAISGDTLIVGAPFDDDAGDDAGSAYVFTRDEGGGWSQVAKLTAPDAAAGDWFGWSVALSGDTLIVGAPFDDDAGADAGSAYLFARDQGGAGAWGQVAKLTPAAAAAGHGFGFSVALSGDTLIVGAPLDDDAEDRPGSAYLFARDRGGAGAWGQVAQLTAADAARRDRFGLSVALSGDTVVVGTAGGDGAGLNSGSIYLFDRVRGDITVTPALPAEGGTADLLRQLIEAVNAADVEAAVALLSDDVLLAEDVCVALADRRGVSASQENCEGAGAARAGLEALVAEQVTLRIVSTDLVGDAVTGALEVRGPFLVQHAEFGLAVERLVFTFWVQARGDRIAVLSGNYDLTDPQTAAAFGALEEQERPAETFSLSDFIDLLEAPGVAFLHIERIREPTQPWIPADSNGLLIEVAGGRAEVYDLFDPEAVQAALDQVRGDEAAFQPLANVTIWGRGEVLVILRAAPDNPAAEAALSAMLGPPAIAAIAGSVPPPAALPTTGSGGLAADNRAEGTSPWVVAPASALVFAGLLDAFRLPLSRQR